MTSQGPSGLKVSQLLPLDHWPPQPMVAQTRALLDGYAASGGRYRETVIKDSGHGPHLDQPDQFLSALTQHLAQA